VFQGECFRERVERLRDIEMESVRETDNWRDREMATAGEWAKKAEGR
jgi:hypothetical protein